MFCHLLDAFQHFCRFARRFTGFFCRFTHLFQNIPDFRPFSGRLKVTILAKVAKVRIDPILRQESYWNPTRAQTGLYAASGRHLLRKPSVLSRCGKPGCCHGGAGRSTQVVQGGGVYPGCVGGRCTPGLGSPPAVPWVVQYSWCTSRLPVIAVHRGTGTGRTRLSKTSLLQPG